MVNNFFNPTAGGSIVELKRLNEEIENDVHNPEVSDEEILKKEIRKSWEAYNLQCGYYGKFNGIPY